MGAMVRFKVKSPKSERRTWRRHFPIWLGLTHIATGSNRKVAGLSLRTGNTMRGFAIRRTVTPLCPRCRQPLDGYNVDDPGEGRR